MAAGLKICLAEESFRSQDANETMTCKLKALIIWSNGKFE